MKTVSKEALYAALQQSIPGRQYLSLVSSNTPVKEGQRFEIHHKHPRALGGDNSESNLVRLTTFQHCLAHLLLAKSYPCLETLNPIILLSGKQVHTLSDLEKVSLEECYGWSKLREKAFEELHRQNFFTDEVRKKMSESHRGKPTSRRGTTLPDQWKEKLSKVWTGKPKPWLRGKSTSSLGKIWINKNGVGKRIYPQDLEKFEQDGWIRGCICKSSQKR